MWVKKDRFSQSEHGIRKGRCPDGSVGTVGHEKGSYSYPELQHGIITEITIFQSHI